jgi:hypothetical protein
MKPSKLAKRIVDIFYNGTFLSRKDAAKEVQRILDAEKSGKKHLHDEHIAGIIAAKAVDPSWPDKVAVVAKALFGNCNQMLNYNYVIYPDKFGSYLFDPLHSESGCWKIVEALWAKGINIYFAADENILEIGNSDDNAIQGHGSTFAEQLVDAAYQWAKNQNQVKEN